MGVLLIFHDKLPTENKVLDHLEFISKVLPGHLTHLSALVVFCTSTSQQGVKYQLDIWISGEFYEYSRKNCQRREKFMTFNWYKFLGGILHFKPTAGCQISTLIFGLGDLWIFHEKLPTGGKVHDHLGFSQRYNPGFQLTSVPGRDSAHQAHSRVSNIKFVIWIGWGLTYVPGWHSAPQVHSRVSNTILIFQGILPMDDKVLDHLGF